jgi:hypothetical protein
MMTRSARSQRAKHACALVFSAVSLVATTANAGGEIHRCTDSTGVTYTDRGCGDNAKAMVFAVALAGPRDLQPAVDRELPVTLGMSPRMVFDALGRPVETIATLQGRQLVEYWLYRGGAGGVTRVAFQHGRVSSVDAR